MIYLGGKSRSLSDTPRVGDVLRLRAPADAPAERTTGVVLSVRKRQDGIWTHVEVAVNGAPSSACPGITPMMVSGMGAMMINGKP